MSKTLKASRQGAFEQTCAAYALVNAVNHLRGPLTESELHEIFDNLINQISSQWSLKKALLEGISGFQLSSLIKRELVNQYDLISAKPYHKKPNEKIDVVWNQAKKFVDSGGVIITNDGDHWSCVVKVTEFRLYLKDSIGIQYISRKDVCTSNKKEEQIFPSRLYFIKRREDL